MRRTSWFRALATMLALWFPLIAGEPGVLQPCPMHGAGPAIARSMGLTGSVPESMGHMHHARHAAPAHGGHVPGHSHHRCTCVNCCAGAALLRAADAPTLATGTVLIGSPASEASAQTLARPAPEYSRPYTTGPPRV